MRSYIYRYRDPDAQFEQFFRVLRRHQTYDFQDEKVSLLRQYRIDNSAIQAMSIDDRLSIHTWISQIRRPELYEAFWRVQLPKADRFTSRPYNGDITRTLERWRSWFHAHREPTLEELHLSLSMQRWLRKPRAG